ncbi:MAG: IclR family transcriptional regulator [Spirochaetota bacterium]
MEKVLPEEKEKSSVRALDKAINALELIATLDGDIDLSALSKMTEIPKSTMLRLLNTLSSHNLIYQDEKTKRFRLGMQLIALGRAAERSFNLVQHMHPFLVELSEKIGETASLMVLEGNCSVYIDQVVSTRLIRGQPQIGKSIELHCSSGGKVLLSAMNDTKIASMLAGKVLKPRTEKTIIEPEELKREISKIRELGYAVDDEEAEIGGRCVAVPLWDRNGNTIAAISVMGPTTRIRQKDFPKIASQVKEFVLQASKSLGYRCESEMIHKN